MRAEEYVGGLKGILWDTEMLLEQEDDPRGIAVLQAVTVGTIPHEFAIVNLTKLVNLPIDNGIIFRSA